MMTDRRREFWSRYEIAPSASLLGEGRYGSVYRATERATGEIVAIKKVAMEDMDRGIPSTALREVSILRLLEHSPHIVNMRTVFYDYDRGTGSRELNIVFDYMPCDLKKYIQSQKQFISEKIVKRLVLQLMQGTYDMHTAGVFHRDLKPHNLLVKNPNCELPELKIADLGLARTHSVPIASLTHEIGSLHYRAPEVLLGCRYYSHGVDMWSIGCIFAELFTKRTLFPGSSEFHQLITIFQTLGTPDKSSWPASPFLKSWHEFPQWNQNTLNEILPDINPLAFDLIRRLLVINPDERITITEALNHPYFTTDPVDLTLVEEDGSSSGSSSAGQENHYVN
eukprot:g5096.t1